MSAAEVMRLTRMGSFRMDGPAAARSRSSRSCAAKQDARTTAGAAQMAMLRRIPQILRFMPGTAQDVRAYFLTLQYWLAGSDDERREHGALPRRPLRGRSAQAAARPLKAASPVDYPDVGVYHPRLPARLAATRRRAAAARDRAAPSASC